MVSANWQKIGCIEACEGTSDATGVFNGSFVSVILDGVWCGSCDSKADFEAKHCQPRHIIERCADGAVFVRSAEQVDGVPKRGAIVRPIGHSWWSDHVGGAKGPSTQDEAIAAAVAYVTAR